MKKDPIEGQVAIVMDPSYGTRLRLVASKMPVWIVNSVANEKVARSLWESGANVTTFNVSNPDHVDENLLKVLPDVELHHGNLSSLLVIGVPKSEALAARLAGQGLTNAREVEFGFTVDVVRADI